MIEFVTSTWTAAIGVGTVSDTVTTWSSLTSRCQSATVRYGLARSALRYQRTAVATSSRHTELSGRSGFTGNRSRTSACSGARATGARPTSSASARPLNLAFDTESHRSFFGPKKFLLNGDGSYPCYFCVQRSVANRCYP